MTHLKDGRLDEHNYSADEEVNVNLGLVRHVYTIDEVYGSIPALPDRETGDFDDMIEDAMADHADWVVERMRRGEE